MGQSFVFTSIPPIGREIGLAEAEIGLIITSGAVVLVLFSFFWGRWIDRIGLRRAMQIGMLTYAIATASLGFVFALALASDLSAQSAFWLAIVLRVIFSAASGGVFPSAQAYLVARSSAEGRVKAITKMSLAFSIGMLVGPAMAALFTSISLDAPFYLIAAAAFLSFSLLQVFMGKTKREKQSNKVQAINWLKHPALPMLLMIFLMNLSMTGTQQVTVFYLQDLLSLSAQGAAQRGGIAMTLLSLMMMATQMLAVQVLQWRPARLIYMGAGFLFCSMMMFMLLQSWWGYLLAMATFGSAIGFLFPSIVAAQTLLSNPDEQARVASINVSAQGSGLIVGPATCAALYQLNPLYPFMLVSMVAVFMIMFFGAWHFRRHRNKQFSL